MGNVRAVLFALLLGASAFAACGGEVKPPAAPVDTAKVCDGTPRGCALGQACIDGRCRASACTADVDCGGALVCFEAACIARECKTNSACMGADQAGGTEDDRSCVGGTCLNMSCPRDGERCPPEHKEPCASNHDCGVGRLCFDGGCTVPECASEKDCGVRICVSGLCVDKECGAAKKCAEGKSCVNGVCAHVAK